MDLILLAHDRNQRQDPVDMVMSHQLLLKPWEFCDCEKLKCRSSESFSSSGRTASRSLQRQVMFVCE